MHGRALTEGARCGGEARALPIFLQPTGGVRIAMVFPLEDLLGSRAAPVVGRCSDTVKVSPTQVTGNIYVCDSEEDRRLRVA